MFFDVGSTLISNQRESEKMILKADFKYKFIQRVISQNEKKQRVKFWFRSFTTRQILDWKKYNALDCELKIFWHARFWKNVCIQEITFGFFLLRENDILCIFLCFFKKHVFVTKISLPVRFWIEKNTKRQVLKEFFFVLPDFE